MRRTMPTTSSASTRRSCRPGSACSWPWPRSPTTARSWSRVRTAPRHWPTLEAIRDNPAPYGQIPQIDGLIQTVQGINDVAVVQHREQAIKRVDALIAEVRRRWTRSRPTPTCATRRCTPLQEMKVKIGGLASIPRIRYQEEQAGNLLDEAMLAIERAMAPAAAADTAGSSPGTVPAALTREATASLQGDPCRRVRPDHLPRIRSRGRRPTSTSSRPNCWLGHSFRHRARIK